MRSIKALAFRFSVLAFSLAALSACIIRHH